MSTSSMKTLLRLHWVNVRTSVFVFWGILLAVAIAVLFLGYISLADGGKVDINIGAIMAVTIYVLVASLITVGETFPFALGMNIRRKDFYGSVVISLTALSLVFSAASTLLALLEQSITDRLDLKMTVFNIGTDKVLPQSDQFAIYLGACLFVFAAGFFISIISYRFGKLGVLLMGGVVLFLIILASTAGNDAVAHFFSSIGSVKEFMAWLLLPTAALLAASYPLMQRMTVNG